MLQKDHANLGWSRKIINEEVYTKVQPERSLLQEVTHRRLELFGHIGRMSNIGKNKSLVFGIKDGNLKKV